MIYFLYGEDTFRSRGYLAFLRGQFTKGITDPDVLHRSAAALTPSTLEELLRGISLLSSRRMVIVEDALDNIEIKESLSNIIKKGVPEDLTLILYEDGEPDRRLGLFKLLEKSTHASRFTPLTAVALHQYVRQLIADRQLSLDEQLMERLLNLTGNDLWRVDRELYKLSAYAETNPLTLESLEQLVTGNLENDIFGILEALSRHHLAYANKLLADLLQRGEDPIGILAVISWQLRNLIRIGALVAQHKSPPVIARITGLHPYVVSNTLKQLSRFSPRWLMGAYQLAVRIDWRIKQGGIGASDAVDWLVTALAV